MGATEPITSRPWLPCGRKRWSVGARVLGLRIQIPLRALMFVVFVVYSVGSGLCAGLKARSEESYLVCVSMCDLDASKRGRPRPKL
jgi:hypothetical protein